MSTSLLPESPPMNDSEIQLLKKVVSYWIRGIRDLNVYGSVLRETRSQDRLKNSATRLASLAMCKLPWWTWASPTKSAIPTTPLYQGAHFNSRASSVV